MVSKKKYLKHDPKLEITRFENVLVKKECVVQGLYNEGKKLPFWAVFLETVKNLGALEVPFLKEEVLFISFSLHGDETPKTDGFTMAF